jgi:hypothetical protein
MAGSWWQRVDDWARCTFFGIGHWYEKRRAGTEELLATRERLIRAFASHAGGFGGPAVMGIAACLKDNERELRRRGVHVDSNDWRKYLGTRR